MGNVKISAQELEELKNKTKQQREKLDAIIQQIDSAVKNKDWRAAAAESFEAEWMKDKGRLSELKNALDEWQKQLEKHRQVAEYVNRPFN